MEAVRVHDVDVTRVAGDFGDAKLDAIDHCWNAEKTACPTAGPVSFASLPAPELGKPGVSRGQVAANQSGLRLLLRTGNVPRDHAMRSGENQGSSSMRPYVTEKSEHLNGTKPRPVLERCVVEVPRGRWHIPSHVGLRERHENAWALTVLPMVTKQISESTLHRWTPQAIQRAGARQPTEPGWSPYPPCRGALRAGPLLGGQERPDLFTRLSSIAEVETSGQFHQALIGKR